MAKQGMKRPERTHTQPKNDRPPVPEIQGKAKHGKAPAVENSVGGKGSSKRDRHAIYYKNEKPISPDVYPVIDTDLARDNLENHMTEADKQDLQ